MRPLFPHRTRIQPRTATIRRRVVIGAIRAFLDRVGASGKAPGSLARALRRQVDREFP